jgi:hypothetical protein
MSSKVVKNLAMSFCKVSEETVEKNILKKNKQPGGDNQVTSTQGTIGHRKNKNPSASAQNKTSEKEQDKSVVLAQQAKRKAPK